MNINLSQKQSWRNKRIERMEKEEDQFSFEYYRQKFLDAQLCAFIMGGCIFLCAIIFLLASCNQEASAEEINLAIISEIESSNNPLAHNIEDDSRGLYQITPICLKDWNAFNAKKYQPNDLWIPAVNREIANWYLNKRIPQMLAHYKIEDTVNNRISAYNAGISCLVKNKPLPSITKNYIKKYARLVVSR